MTVLAAIDDWPVDNAAIGITGPRETLDRHGPTDRVFRMASVTKPLAAYAVLVAVDSGRLDLEDTVDDRGATVRHLLAHAAGYPFTGREPISPVGARRIYSNTGFDLLGELVEERTGRSIGSYLRQQVLLPLGMDDTVLDGSPAADAEGSVDDLLLFARELLHPTLIDASLAEEARTPQYPALDGVLPGHGRQDPNEWGLGFEIRGTKSPHWTGAEHPPTTFGHFGQSGSFLWVDPEHDLAAAFLGDRDYGAWSAEHWSEFNAQVLSHYAEA
jgi:CubicO group peptidase (beta-lactamase class C family)